MKRNLYTFQKEGLRNTLALAFTSFLISSFNHLIVCQIVYMCLTFIGRAEVRKFGT